MTGAVRMALEAAGEATWQAIDLIGDIPPDTPQAQQIAAAAIAAFLREPPSFVDVPDSDPELAAEGFTSSLDLMSAQALADAVEAAAKEGV